MSRFPTGRRRIPFGSCVRKSKLEKLHCICRMPNDKERAMIACDQCKGWFHKDCMGLDVVKSYKTEEWMCQDCQEFLENLRK